MKKEKEHGKVRMADPKKPSDNDGDEGGSIFFNPNKLFGGGKPKAPAKGDPNRIFGGGDDKPNPVADSLKRAFKVK